MKSSIRAQQEQNPEALAAGWGDVLARIDTPAAEASLELLAELAIHMLRQHRGST
jgi:hypothetical protein